MEITDTSGATRRKSRLLKILKGLVVFVLLLGLLGFLVAPPIIKSVLVDKLSASLQRPVSIAAIHINPYTLSFQVDGISVQDAIGGETLASLDKLHAQLGFSSFAQLTPVVNQLRLDGPKFRLVRLSANRYNISDLLDQMLAPPKEPRKPRNPNDALRFSVNNIEVHGGRLEFIDRVVNKTHVATDIEIGLPFVSNLPKQTQIFIEPSFSAKIDGAPFGLKGRTKPFADSLDTDVSLDLGNLQLGKFFDYLPRSLALKLPSGSITSRLKLAFSEPNDAPATLILSGTITLDDLALTQADDRPLVEFKRMDVDLRSIDLLQRKLSISSVRVQAPKINLVLARDGRTNWEAALLAASRNEHETPKIPTASAPDKASGNSAAMTWEVDQISVVDGSIRWLDEYTGLDSKAAAIASATNTVRTLDGVKITVQNLSGKQNSPAKVAVAFSIDHKGSVSIDGTLAPAPLDATLNVDIQGIELSPWQRYLGDQFELTLARGQVAVQGTLVAKKTPSGSVAGGFKGRLAVADFSSLEKLHASDFVSWKTMRVDGLDAQSDPLAVTIEQIGIDSFYARLIVSPTGELNLFHIAHNHKTVAVPSAPVSRQSGASVAPVAAKAAPAFPLKIAKITLTNGRVAFTDHFVRPNYSANLTKVSGHITGLSRAADSSATLNLRAQYSGSAPVLVSGKLNPLAAKPTLDMQAEVKDVDLPPFSTYAGKYAGYAVEKGKLSMSVKYKIEDSKLVAENHIKLDQLTFGAKIESPTATKLPVLLAVALLKDRNGLIDVDLPIAGSLDDPQFSVGSIIVKVIINLIAKAVSAPFALLGSLFGGGEELSNIHFDSGSSVLTDDARKRLENLDKALLDRPGLKLEISGGALASADEAGVKQAILDHQVKGEMIDEAAKKGSQSAAADDLQIDPAQYPGLIKKLYRAKIAPSVAPLPGPERGKVNKGEPKPDTQPTLSTKEMEEALLANITVTDENLRALAERRAETARAWLVEEGKVPAGRIFLLPAQLQGEMSTGSGGKGASAGVNFSLR